MRLIEVVVLMGAHCVSPVEHTPLMTQAAKVQCAVVVEKDTEQGVVKVTPQEATSDPKVAAVVARFNQTPPNGLTGTGTRIVPAWAPAGGPSTVFTPRPSAASTTPAPAIAPQETAPVAADKPAPGEPPAEESTPAVAEPPPAAVVAEAAPETTAEAPAPLRKKPGVEASQPVQQKTVTAPVKHHGPKRSAAKTQAAKSQPAKPQAAAKVKVPKKGGQCSGAATPKWYTAADGRKKYRCVRVSDAGGSPKRQLY